jgi:thiazole synthase ThiGH ThiG subunit
MLGWISLRCCKSDGTLGADAVPVKHSYAVADKTFMAEAFRMAVIAGRKAYGS